MTVAEQLREEGRQEGLLRGREEGREEGRRLAEIGILVRQLARRFGALEQRAIELLERLVAHTRKPEFHYFHKWEEGDLVLWDNWRIMHCATGTKPGVRRVINRTTIEGNTMLGRVLGAEI